MKIIFINRSDVISLIITILSVAVYILGSLTGGTLSQQLLRNATTGPDGSLHIYLTQAIYSYGGYTYGNKPILDKHSVSSTMLKSYPQGWAMTSALWWHTITPHLNIRQEPIKVLALFYIMVTIWWGSLIYLFNQSILFIIEKVRAKKNDIIAYSGSVMFTILAELLFFINLIRDNFVSFLPVLVFSIGLVILISDFQINKREDNNNPGIFIFEGLLLSGGVMMSWLLAAPIDYIMVFTALIIFHEGSAFKLAKWLISRPRILITSIILILLASSQGFVQILFGGGLTGINGIGNAGNMHYSIMFPLLLFILVIILIIKHRSSLTNMFIACMGGAFFISGTIFYYQLISSGSSGYYSNKINILTFVLLFIFVAVSLIFIFYEYLSAYKSKIIAILFTVGLIMFIPAGSKINNGNLSTVGITSIQYILGKRFLSETSASQISSLLISKQIQSDNLIVYKDLGYAEDTEATYLVPTLSNKVIPICFSEIQHEIFSQWNIKPSVVINCARNSKFFIIASSKDYNRLETDFKGHPNIDIILSS